MKSIQIILLALALNPALAAIERSTIENPKATFANTDHSISANSNGEGVCRHKGLGNLVKVENSSDDEVAVRIDSSGKVIGRPMPVDKVISAITCEKN